MCRRASHVQKESFHTDVLRRQADGSFSADNPLHGEIVDGEVDQIYIGTSNNFALYSSAGTSAGAGSKAFSSGTYVTHTDIKDDHKIDHDDRLPIHMEESSKGDPDYSADEGTLNAAYGSQTHVDDTGSLSIGQNTDSEFPRSLSESGEISSPDSGRHFPSTLSSSHSWQLYLQLLSQVLLPTVSSVFLFVISNVCWCSVQLTSILSNLYLEMVLFVYCSCFFIDAIRNLKTSQFSLVFQMYLLHVSRTDNINFVPWNESSTDAPSSSLFAHLFVRYSVPHSKCNIKSRDVTVTKHGLYMFWNVTHFTSSNRFTPYWCGSIETYRIWIWIDFLLQPGISDKVRSIINDIHSHDYILDASDAYVILVFWLLIMLIIMREWFQLEYRYSKKNITSIVFLFVCHCLLVRYYFRQLQGGVGAFLLIRNDPLLQRQNLSRWNADESIMERSNSRKTL